MTEAYQAPGFVCVPEAGSGADSIPEGVCPEKWVKAQAIKARQAAAFAQTRERNAGMDEVASITVKLLKDGRVMTSSLCMGGPDTGPWFFEQALLGQNVQELAQELRDRLLYGVRF